MFLATSMLLNKTDWINAHTKQTVSQMLQFPTSLTTKVEMLSLQWQDWVVQAWVTESICRIKTSDCISNRGWKDSSICSFFISPLATLPVRNILYLWSDCGLPCPSNEWTMLTDIAWCWNQLLIGRCKFYHTVQNLRRQPISQRSSEIERPCPGKLCRVQCSTSSCWPRLGPVLVKCVQT